MQYLCGVGYHRIDDQENNFLNFEEIELRKLLIDLSCSEYFLADALAAAKNKGITDAHWVVVQYEFEYNPEKTIRPIAKDPILIGSFNYSIVSG